MTIAELLNTPLDELTFSVVDTETTGMYADFSRVMDIGVVQVKNGKVITQWEALIDPKQEVPYWITTFTHLATRDVVGKPTFDKISQKLSELLANTVFVAHNVSFDYSFLTGEMKRLNLGFDYPKLCTVQLARKLLPQLPSANLDRLSDFYKIKVSQRHRALPDAQATAEVLLHFIEIAKTRHGARNYYELSKLQQLHVAPTNFSDTPLPIFT